MLIEGRDLAVHIVRDRLRRAWQRISGRPKETPSVESQWAKCDQEIYGRGEVVCSFHAPQRVAEPLVRQLAEETGTRTDWHYVGGYAVVRTLGNVAHVRAAARSLFPCNFRWYEETSIEEQIDRSSLGTPEAQALRRSVPRATVDRVLRRARELERTRWGHSEDREPERWIGAFETAEEAIEDGRLTYEGDFWIRSGRVPDPADFLPDPSMVLDQMADNAGESCGEVSEDWPDAGNNEALLALELALTRWARRWCPVEFWMADGASKPQPVLNVLPRRART